MLEDPKKIKFFWGGSSDTANLYASYGIKVASFVDLQRKNSKKITKLLTEKLYSC